MLAMQGFLNPLHTDERKQVQAFQSTLTPVERVSIGGVSLAPPGVYPTEMVDSPAQPMDVAPEVAMVVQQDGGVLSESEVVAFLKAAGAPEEWIPDLVTISACESRHRPGAIGDGGNSLGQYQLWRGWAREGEDLMDPLTNAKVAVRVRETRGRFGSAGGWTCATLNNIP